jgi:hypothetical protein
MPYVSNLLGSGLPRSCSSAYSVNEPKLLAKEFFRLPRHTIPCNLIRVRSSPLDWRRILHGFAPQGEVSTISAFLCFSLHRCVRPPTISDTFGYLRRRHLRCMDRQSTALGSRVALGYCRRQSFPRYQRDLPLGLDARGQYPPDAHDAVIREGIGARGQICAGP